MKNPHLRSLIACSIGNILEWFDYTLYGIFATTLSKVFFPQNNPELANLLIYFVFALGFASRPIGGIVLSHIADKIGRKKSLLISILLMSIPTFILGLLPSYKEIGLLAPISLIIIRLLQGVAIGGEFTGAMVYLVEESDARHRGINGSWSDFGSPFGVLIGLLLASVLTSIMSFEDFENFGWRIPFLLSIFIALFGAYLRFKLEETEAFSSTEKEKIPLIETLKHHKKVTISTAFVAAFGGVSFYLLLTFLHNFLKLHTSLSEHDAFEITCLANFAMLIMIPLGGYLSDKFTRKKILIHSVILSCLISIPMFYTLEKSLIISHIIFEILFAAAIGLFFGGRAAFFAEAFPTHVRCTAVSLAFGISHSLFAGTTPLMAEYFLYKTSSIFGLSSIVVIFCILALWALVNIEDRTGLELE